MKKIFSLFTMAFVSMFALVLGVNAEEVASAGDLNSCLGLDTECTLTEDITADAVVPAGKTVVLDLNGKTLTADTTDAIYVQKGATLTIKGEGNVIATKTNYAALFNNGTVIIDGGTFKRDVAGNTNKWYVLLNHGIMTINDATVTIDNEDEITTGSHPSLIENGYYDYTKSTNERLGYVEETNHENPSLTINGGDFIGGLNTVKNDDNGVLEINGGLFKNTVQVSLLNANIATINGGTFETSTGNDKTNIFVKDYGYAAAKGVLTINGGTFNAENVLEGSVTTPVEINGGTFNYTVSFVNNSEERQNKNDNLATAGNVEVVGGTFADDTVKPEEGYTKYQIGTDEYVVAKTITFDTKEENITLTAGQTKTIEVDELVKQYGEFKSSDEKIATISGNVIKAVSEGKAKITVTFDGQTKVINLTVVKNPDTGDNAMIFMVLAVIGLAGAAVTANKLRHN